jgi:hypothetical protein
MGILLLLFAALVWPLALTMDNVVYNIGKFLD